jgi:SAM-dependent methyltransferase
MKSTRVSEHLHSYRRKRTDSSFKKVIGLVSEVADNMEKGKDKIRILDVGCGTGALVEALTKESYDVLGIDADRDCVEITKRYGKSLLMDAGEMEKQFAGQHFDIIIFKDSLEHMNSPLDVISQAKAISTWIIVVVPNPTRMDVQFYNLLRMDYSNPGHLCCWDRSHFTHFLTGKAGLEIVSWKTDEVRLLPGPLHIVTAGLKRLNINFLAPIEEKLLPTVFPYFSRKLIVLARVKSKVD